MHPLMFKPDPEDDHNRQEVEYEEKLVGHLLTYYGLAAYKSMLRQKGQREFGATNLRLSVFLDMFGTYPAILTVAKIRGLARNCTIDKLFNNMPTRKLIEQYLLLRNESCSAETGYYDETSPYYTGPFAMVVPWPYIPKGMVVHDKAVPIDECPSGLKKPCVRLIWTLSKKYQKHGKYLVIEPLDQFLASFSWTPELPTK